MNGDICYTVQEAHLYFATQCFNDCVKMMESPARSSEDDELMKHLAHASLFHWRIVGTPHHFQRGEWLLAKVYTLLESKAKSLHYALRCLDLVRQHDFKDYDLACAYECVARAYALTGDKAMYEKYYTLAEDAGKLIVAEDDKKLFFDEFNKDKWFGIR